MIAYQYVALRYVHNSTIGEYLNMGVAVLVPSNGWFMAECPVETAARFRLTFSDFNLDWYLEYVSRINRRFYELSKTPIFNIEFDEVVREAGFRKENNLQYSNSGSGIVQNDPEKYKELFERLLKTYVHI